MSFRHLIQLSLFCILMAGCSKTNNKIEITLPAEKLSVDIPMEIVNLSLPVNDNIMQASMVKGKKRSFLLQNAPALWNSQNSMEVDRCYCTILPAHAESGQYVLNNVSESDAFSFKEDTSAGRLYLYEGDKPVFAYNFKEQKAPAGTDEAYNRSSYFHPIYDLNGTILTDDFPHGEAHHRGMWCSWAFAYIDGQTYEPWWKFKIFNTEFENWLLKETGPVCATLGVKNAWYIVGERKVMDEWIWIRVFKAGAYGRVVDINLTYNSLEPMDVQGRPPTKWYTGFSFRFGPREETIITTPDGIEEGDSNLKKYAWADLSARFADSHNMSGVSIFQHPDNPDVPAGWTLRHYGFLGVAWPGPEKYHFEPSTPLTLRYRLWIHNGDALDGKVIDAYNLFAEPPKIEAVE